MIFNNNMVLMKYTEAASNLAIKYHYDIESLSSKCFEGQRTENKKYIMIAELGEDSASCITVDPREKVIMRKSYDYDNILKNFELITQDYFLRVYDNTLQEITKFP